MGTEKATAKTKKADKFAPEIREELAIPFIAIMEIRNKNKDLTVNELVKAFVEEETEKLTVEELAEYAAAKSKTEKSQQWAREEIVRKVVAGKQ